MSTYDLRPEGRASQPRIALGILALMALAAGVPACLDLDPIPAEQVRAPLAAADAGAFGDCDRCFEASCVAEIEVCREDTGCNALYECVEEQGCLHSATQTGTLKCLYPCLMKLKINNAQHPIVLSYTPTGDCFIEHCADLCRAIAVDAGATE